METVQTSGIRTVAPIMLANGLLLDGEAERGADGKYLVKNQQGWEQHYDGTGKRVPAVGEYIVTLKQSHEQNDHALQGILRDLSESMLCAGKINYSNSNLPVGDGYLDVLVKDPAWRKALEDEVFQYEAPEAIDVMQQASGKRPYILTPDASGRKSRPERAVWLFIYADRSYLVCDYYPLGNGGRSRGVREVGSAAGARVENGSSHRKAAKTVEQVLDERIEEELSRFDGFAGTYSQEKYAKIKQEVAQNLKGLYKK